MSDDSCNLILIIPNYIKLELKRLLGQGCTLRLWECTPGCLDAWRGLAGGLDPYVATPQNTLNLKKRSGNGCELSLPVTPRFVVALFVRPLNLQLDACTKDKHWQIDSMSKRVNDFENVSVLGMPGTCSDGDRYLLTCCNIFRMQLKRFLIRFGTRYDITHRASLIDMKVLMEQQSFRHFLVMQTTIAGVCPGQQNTELVSLVGGGSG